MQLAEPASLCKPSGKPSTWFPLERPVQKGLAGWLAGWLAVCLAGWVADKLAGWLAGTLASGWLALRLAD